ncbi:hypothetical protein WEI85_08810 [Actinomycetes bacterium KLBMP 9797]
MPKTSARPDLAGLLDVQRRIVRRDQVVGTALTDGTLRWLLQSHQWQAVLPSIYGCFSGQLTDEQREIAAQLYCGSSSQLTGPAALRAHGMRYVPEDERLHMLVPHARHLSSSGFVVVQRTHRLDDRPIERGLVQVVSPARAAADTARMCEDLRAVRAIVAESVQRRLTTVPQLRAELTAGSRKGSGLLRQAIDEVSDGVRSAPEASLRDIAQATAALPPILWNPTLVTLDGVELPTPDGWIDEVGIALEVDSREHHAMPEEWARTLHRHNVLTSLGALVLHFTPTAVYTTPEAVRRTMVSAYRERHRTGAKAAIRVRDS